jgi:hypothetical protein
MDSTTELSAINSMLATVGEAPINTLEDLGVIDAVTARSALREVTREVLVEGYTFNTDQGFPLSPEGFAPFEIKLPPNALSVTPSGEYAGLVVRGNRMYDPATFSYTFKDHPAVPCEIVWHMDFDELPEVTRQYVATRAARRFQKRAVTSELIHAITEEDERTAMWRHRRANTRLKRRNYLVESQSVRNITSNR